MIKGLGSEWVLVDGFMHGLGLVMSEDGKDSYFQYIFIMELSTF